MSFMIVPLFLQSKHTPTTWVPAYPLANLPVGVVFANFEVLSEAILIMKFIDTERTSERWVGYPFRMILHVFGDILLELT